MFQDGGYVFKRAETPEEIEQVHRLNYRTFVAEVGQYGDPGTGLLVDKFHHKNVYFIALINGEVVGMMAAHDQPPFSIAERLPDPDILTRPGTRPLEVRLLAIVPEHRKSTVIGGLFYLFYEHARQHGHTHAYISGIEGQLPLYQQLGFEPLGPAVPGGQVRFVPMGGDLKRMIERHQRSLQLWHKRRQRLAARPAELLCLLPGPVAIAPAVHEAFRKPPIYHRGPAFIALFERTRQALATLVGARASALFNGSGTLANEAVAALLAADPGPGRGLLLVSGEFGERLTRQVTRFGLRPRVLTWPWGRPWDLHEVEAALANEPTGSWVWGVHLESSTGVLNDLPGLVRLARRYGVRVCADCVSSIGAVPLDLSEVHLATGASGKSLGAYAGAAVVFADPAALAGLDTSRVPSYLDVPAALATAGPRYTFPSSTLFALEAALADYATPEKAASRYRRYAEMGQMVRQRLREAGLPPLAEEAHACPVVTTFAPPGDESSEAFVARCEQWGFVVGGQSGYLASRRLVQIATMGAVTGEALAPLFERLRGGHQTNGSTDREMTAALS